ncbi:CDGSH iron-sulfur domain-containing protein [Halomicrobium katesii]|uniref:CDGSH iron-sulfur domain-containing protein n=1 Tax=Halomicrobium katesii TaxID=437163 RepID=UPI000361C2A1|nr:CDGSH iron-sulfur domain-containing protein [Halomicrobium katesii]
MSRKITHDAEGPYVIDEDELEEQGGTVAVCRCGLSANKPHCDGSHQAVADEDDVVYEYQGDDEGERTVVDE